MIAFLLGTKTGRTIAGALAVAALVGFAVWWLRYDAVATERAKQEAEALRDRLGHITENREDRDNAKNLDDDGLFNALGRWFMPDAGG